jgi:hypothetical protein
MVVLDLPKIFINIPNPSTDANVAAVREIVLDLGRPLFFPEHERIYAEVFQANIPYSWVNVSEVLFQNARFDVNGTLFTLPQGTYASIQQINAGIATLLRNNIPPLTDDGLVTGNPGFSLVGDANQQRVVLTTLAGFTVTVTPGVGSVLGFPTGAFLPSTVTQNSLAITFLDIAVNGLYIVTDLAEGNLAVLTYDNTQADANILASVQIRPDDNE